jgi:hypothetical protein
LIGKHLLCKQAYASSNLVISTGLLLPLVGPSGLPGVGRTPFGPVAQWSVRPPVERKVAGSSPVRVACTSIREEFPVKTVNIPNSI